MAPSADSAVIGIDVGGTHTDVVIARAGTVTRGKALTTYDDFARGALSAVEVAAGELGETLEDVLSTTSLVVNATTVVTNSIAQLDGARVGVVVTAGFRDTFLLAGGPRLNVYDDHLQTNVPMLVRPEDVVEVEERVGFNGEVIVPLDADAASDAVIRLLEDNEVDALAVCLLQSHSNPIHEVAIERIARAQSSDLHVSTSHSLYPVSGEVRRWNTAILNAFVHEHATSYLRSMRQSFADAGLAGQVVYFQGLGGCITETLAVKHPLSLLRSGPAGGVVGACQMARQLEQPRFVLADMGGTSLETTVMESAQPRIGTRVDVDRWQTGAKLVDVLSIGAGGGSIAWVSERGAPQVGPQSAGSTPGPAAYARGGTEPTVTDAMVALGFIDTTNYLGGREALDGSLARGAVHDRFGRLLQLSAEEAASAIHDLVATNMAAAIREVTVDRGYDPRGLTLIGFGGMFGLFAGALAARLGMTDVLLPRNASAFSAWGLLVADFVVRKDRSIEWDLDDLDALEEVEGVDERATSEAIADLVGAGFAEEGLMLSRSVMLRFKGQSHELEVPLERVPTCEGEVADVRERFLDAYARAYGTGAIWRDVPIVGVQYTVTASALVDKPQLPERVVSEERVVQPTGTREVFLPAHREWQAVPVFHDRQLDPGSSVRGPAILDASDTTIYVPERASARRDEFDNLRLTLTGEHETWAA